MKIPDRMTPAYAQEFDEWFDATYKSDADMVERTLIELNDKFPKALWVKRKRVQLYSYMRSFSGVAISWREFSDSGGALPNQQAKNIIKAYENGFVELNGVKISVAENVEVLSDDARFALVSGFYEEPERQGLAELLSSNDRILECGVGAGYMACVAQKIHPEISYLGIEANPDLIGFISLNQALNGVSFEVQNFAVGPAEGIVEFAKCSNFLASRVSPDDEEGAVITNVKQLSFNRLLDDYKPTFLLMDIEGLEYETLIGSRLDGVKKIVLEVHPQTVGNTELNKLLVHFHSLGFELRFDLGARFVWCLTRA